MSVQKEFQHDHVPSACPGTTGETAGAASACQGCPNQEICSSSSASGVDPRAVAAREAREIAERLKDVKHKVIVLSGKGGVGKSTFSATLARGLSGGPQQGVGGLQVGLLDADICGPSAPLMLGVEGVDVHRSSSGWSPVYAEEGLAVMSVGFLLESREQAVVWRGPKKNGLIKQFLRDVDWGPLDYLVVDTPPGTSDEHLSLVSYMKAAKISGAVVVTTPQELALLDVRKEINFCKKVGLSIVGVVENMSGFVCPRCSHASQIFPPTTGGAKAMALEMGVPFLGSIPIDPRLARAADDGVSFLEAYPDSPAAVAYLQIIAKIRESVEKH